MGQIIMIFSVLVFTLSSHAELKPKIDWDVKTVVSIEPTGSGNVHSGIRYRAIVSSSVGTENPTYLVIEKTKEPTAPGNPYSLEWSKRVTIPELDQLNDIKKSETGYMGDFTNLKWSNKSFAFEIPTAKKKLICLVSDVEAATLKANCK